MNIVSSKLVYLNWFAGMPPWEKTYAEAWQRVHGTPYNISQQIDCIYKVLYDMGISQTSLYTPITGNLSTQKWKMQLPTTGGSSMQPLPSTMKY